MSARRFLVAGHTGTFVRVGQAFYTDDNGQVVEHDWLRMVPTGGGDEVWVAPTDVTALDRPEPLAPHVAAMFAEMGVTVA